MPVRACGVEDVLPLRAAILRPGRPMDTARFDGDALPGTRHWVLVEDERARACLSVMPAPSPRAPDRRWQLRGMAAAEQGQGHGGVLLAAVQTVVNEPMWCNARERAVAFYARHGWRVVSPPFDITGIGPHFEMWWEPA